MNYGPTCILALFAMATTATAASADDQIMVAAQEVEASLSPRPQRQRIVNVPALTFDLRATFRCAGEPVSVTLSVADAFLTRDSVDLGDERATQATLTVPARQLAMNPNRQFCIANDERVEGAADEVLVAPGFASVHASLRCANEDGESVHYATAPLNVRLICDREPAAVEPDQDPSSEGSSETR